MHICRIHNIKLPDDLAPSKSRPEIDSLVEQGLKLQDIGDRVGLSKERIRQYIFESGQSKEYKNAKLSIKYEIINKRKSILSLLEERTSQLFEKEDIAYKKAVEYRSRTIPLESLLLIFRRYYEAKDNGKILSLVELSNGTGIAPTYMSRILRRVGLEPLYGIRNRHANLNSKEIEAILRSSEIDMPIPDIGYFLALPEHLISQYINKRKVRSYYQYKVKGKGNYLTYRIASQVYEAKDLGFKSEEIAELIETKKEMVELALEKRFELEPKIIEGLRILYNRTDIDRPFN